MKSNVMRKVLLIVCALLPLMLTAPAANAAIQTYDYGGGCTKKVYGRSAFSDFSYETVMECPIFIPGDFFAFGQHFLQVDILPNCQGVTSNAPVFLQANGTPILLNSRPKATMVVGPLGGGWFWSLTGFPTSVVKFTYRARDIRIECIGAIRAHKVY